MSQSAISVRNLFRYFGNVKAVNGISFDIPHGSVCGFVGANGSGKTSTMRILATLDYPTMGHIEICGINIIHHPKEIRKLIGWMPDHFGNYEHMTVLEYLDFYARAIGYRGRERQMRIQEIMEFTDLVSLADRLSNKLSKGMTQRLGLSRALLNDPQVLIMDEPAAGLDPKARVELKHLIRILSQEGKTIFISSHILSELGEMCDTLLFVDAGRIVHHGTSEELRQNEMDTTTYNIQVFGNPSQLSDWAVLQDDLKVVESTKKGARLQFQNSDPENAARILRHLIRDGIQITEFHREERNLEDAFIDMLGKIEREQTTTATPPSLPATSP